MHPDKIKEYSQHYRENHQDEINRRNRERRALNPEEDREYKRIWRLNHPNERRDYQQKYYYSNRARIIERSRKELADLKFQVFSHYSVLHSPMCFQCGEDDLDVLCIDHINGNGNQERKKINRFGGNGFYRWLRTNGYPEGYQVLCANCNMKKARYEERELR